MKHIIFIDNPQGLTDEDVNILFNAANVGLNTAMGEGWGLCNFEAAACGVPQIVPAIGGFLDFFNKDNAIMIKPKVNVYTDMALDGCPGCAEICDAADFADAIDVYYGDDSLRKMHGDNARKSILTNYRWQALGEKLYNQICTVVAKPAEHEVEPKTPALNKISLEDLESLSQNLNLTDSNIEVALEAPVVASPAPVAVVDPVADPVAPVFAPTVVPSVAPAPVPKSPSARKDDVRTRLRAKLAAKKHEVKRTDGKRRITVVEESSEDELPLDKEELLKLRTKIDKLLVK